MKPNLTWFHLFNKYLACLVTIAGLPNLASIVLFLGDSQSYFNTVPNSIFVNLSLDQIMQNIYIQG